ncbi:MAG: HEAT repeat domain-containing protein [Planctomycetes bacterium]|nr:HEAT repeat domain-containing protein [Planctomycetota bacterium]
MNTLYKTAWAVWFCVMTVLSGCGIQQTSPQKLTPQALREKAKEVLIQAAESEDAALRSHGLESFAQLKDDLEAPAYVRKGMHDPSEVVRFAAAMAAGDLKDYTSRPLLEQLLHSENASVKMAAAYGLEKMGDTRFGRWYDHVLLGDDANLCGQACLILGRLGSGPLRPHSRDKLWQVLNKQGQAVPVKLQAAEALARLGDKTILKKLLVYANSGYGDDRIIAISGLALLGGPEVVGMLRALADDPQIEVRLAAVRALGHQAESPHLELVRKHVTYKDSQGNPLATARVRGLAILALGKVGTKADAKRLYKAMTDKMPYIRVAAARATIDYLKRRVWSASETEGI